MVVAIFKLLLKNNLVGHKTKLVGPVPQCAPPWLRHCVHLLKVIFGVESACEIKYTPSSPVSVKKKHTVNKKLTICQMDKTV